MVSPRPVLFVAALACAGLWTVGSVAADDVAPVFIGSVTAEALFERPAAFTELAADSPLSAGPAAGIAGECCHDSCCPWWSVQAGAVILSRSARSTLIMADANTGATVLDAGDFGAQAAGGPDLTLRRWLDADRSAEVRFFMVDGWGPQVAFTTPAVWTLPSNPPLFGLGVADIAARYKARLYSTEFNVRRGANEWLTWLVGLRYVELNEDLTLGVDFGNNSATATFRSANRLYGGQAGAYVTILDRDPFRVEGVGKAGLYGNAASSGVAVEQQIGPTFLANDRQGQVAFLGELGILTAYQWSEAVTLRAGYQLLWLEGVAIAPDQASALQVITADGINSTGGAFYHGALVSAEVAW